MRSNFDWYPIEPELLDVLEADGFFIALETAAPELIQVDPTFYPEGFSGVDASLGPDRTYVITPAGVWLRSETDPQQLTLIELDPRHYRVVHETLTDETPQASDFDTRVIADLPDPLDTSIDVWPAATIYELYRSPRLKIQASISGESVVIHHAHDAAVDVATAQLDNETPWAFHSLKPPPRRTDSNVEPVQLDETTTALLACCGDHQAFLFDPVSGAYVRFSVPFIGPAFGGEVVDGSAMFMTPTEPAAYTLAETRSDQRWRSPEMPPNIVQPGYQRYETASWNGQWILWPRSSGRYAPRGSIYNPTTHTWTDLPALPTDRPAHANIAVAADHLFVIGGLPASGGGSERLVGISLDLNDPDADWSESPALLPEPNGCECNLGSQRILVATESTIYILVTDLASGVSSEGVLLEYDIATGETNVTDLAEAPPLPVAADKTGRIIWLTASDEILVTETDPTDD